MVLGCSQSNPPTLVPGDDRRAALTPRQPSAWWQRSRTFSVIAIAAAMISTVAFTVVSISPHDRVIVGSPRPTYPAGKSDEDQIRGVLQAISDSYNRKDVKSAEEQLCTRARSQWNPALEQVWMNYRLRHGPYQFVLASIRVSGVVADVTGRQTYVNDAAPTDFTAAMERQRNGWKMCSST